MLIVAQMPQQIQLSLDLIEVHGGGLRLWLLSRGVLLLLLLL